MGLGHHRLLHRPFLVSDAIFLLRDCRKGGAHVHVINAKLQYAAFDATDGVVVSSG